MLDHRTKNQVFELMQDYDRVGTVTVTCDTLAKALKLKRSVTLEALQMLIIEERVEYARKNPVSSQSRFQLAAKGFRR